MSQTAVSPRALPRALRAGSRRVLALLAAVLVLLMASSGMLPAHSAPTGALTLEKRIDKEVLEPGETAVYELYPGCDHPTSLCENTVVTDPIPEPLVVEDVNVVGGGLYEVEHAGNNVSVRFLDQHTDGSIGLADGSTPTVYITVRLPQSTPPKMNDKVLNNTAEVTADNADTKQASADVTLKVPVTLGATVDKAWGVDSVPAGSSQDIPLRLTNIKNNSNIGADSLELLEPSGGPNPFETVEVVALKNVILPEGANQAQIFVTVDSAEVAGDISDRPTLPMSVDPADIKGLRVVFSHSNESGQIVADGMAGSIELVTQLRSGADDESVHNQVSVVASTPQGDSVPATAEDSFTIAPAQYSVQATKSIRPGTIVEGETSQVSISGTNTSNQALDTMTLTEPAGESSFFGEGMEFNDFTDTTWPAGASAGSVTIGDNEYELTEANGNVVWPSNLPSDLDNFVITFTGTFAPGSSIGANFSVTGTMEGTYTNIVEAGGSAGENPVDSDTANADLTVEEPNVEFDGRKYFVDSGSVAVGDAGEPYAAVVEGRVGEEITAILQGWVSSKNSDVPAIVLEDVFNDDFKAGLDTTELRIEQDLGAQSVLVERLVGSSWITVTADAGKYALGADTEGVRVTYTADPAGPGFAKDQRAQVAIDFVVAAELDDKTELENVVVIGPGDDGIGEGVESGGNFTVNRELLLSVAKTWSPDTIAITPDTANPSSTILLEAQNTSAYAVNFLGISEPAGETDAFEYLDLTGLTASLHGNVAGNSPRNEDVVLTLRFADKSSQTIKGGAALNPEGVDWPNVVGFDFALDSPDELIPRGARFVIEVATELRSETRTDGVAMDAALAALEPAYVIPNQVDAKIRRDGEDPVRGSADDSIQVETVNSVDITADVVKTFRPDSGTFRKPGGAPNEVGVQFALATGSDRADAITFEDVDPTFWNAFDFQSWSSFDVTYWAADDQIQLDIEYFVGGTFTAGDDGSLNVAGGNWVKSGPFSITGTGLPNNFGTGLPADVEPGEIHGVRLTIQTTDHSTLPGTPNSVTERDDYSVDLVVNPRLQLRSGGPNADGETPNPGEAEAATVVNDLTGTASRLGGDPVGDKDDATFTFVPGETSAKVSKTDKGSKNTSTTAGGVITYTLSVENTGAEPIVDPVITDVLPTDADGPQLLFSQDGTVTYSVAPEGASITTDPEEITITEDYESAEPSIAITFPKGSVLLPGEIYTVNLPVEVRAGHQPATGIVNTLRVTSGGSDAVWEDTAVVNVLAGQAYQSRKLVREVVAEGAEPTGNIFAQGAPESSVCHDYGDGFYRYPCVVETQPGGQAEWKITVTNTGNVVAQELEILDILPWTGDKHVVPSLSSFDRGTEWTPTLSHIAEPIAPEGTTVTAEYLLGDPSECVPSGPTSDPWQGCDAEGLWTTQLPDDVAEINAIKWLFAFDNGLLPTEEVTVSFITESDIFWPEGFDRAPEAWNSFAYKATAELNNRTDYRVQEPNKTGITFRNTETYAIGDFVWIDANNDGIQDEGEAPLPGVTVELLDSGDSVIATTTTDERGRYFFDELLAGEYRVQFTLTEEQAELYEFTSLNAGDDVTADSDAVPATGRTATVVLDGTNPNLVGEYGHFEVLATGGIDPTWDAGVVLRPDPTYAIGDLVWIDANSNGVQDEGEEPLPGVTVVLTDGEGIEFSRTTTDAEGRYLFDELLAGEYRVQFILTPAQAERYAFTSYRAGADEARDSNAGEDGYSSIIALGSDNPNLTTDYAHRQVLASEGIDPTWDAGVVLIPEPEPGRVSVGDYVWVDTNGDGIQDEGEPGLPGVTLVLTGPDGKPVTDVYGNRVGPATTDASGWYSFENLPVLDEGQSYTVSIDRKASAEVLAPYVPTIAGAGDDRGRDSSTWQARSSGLTEDGERDPTLDFGFVLAVTDPAPTPDPLPVQPGENLPDTGAGVGGIALAGVLALLAGLAAVLTQRHRVRTRG